MLNTVMYFGNHKIVWPWLGHLFSNWGAWNLGYKTLRHSSWSLIRLCSCSVNESRDAKTARRGSRQDSIVCSNHCQERCLGVSSCRLVLASRLDQVLVLTRSSSSRLVLMYRPVVLSKWHHFWTPCHEILRIRDTVSTYSDMSVWATS